MREAKVGATSEGTWKGRGGVEVHFPGAPAAGEAVSLRCIAQAAASALPSRSTMAPSAWRCGGRAAMLPITAGQASERRHPPPGSPPGISHQVIHQEAVNAPTNENGDEQPRVTVSALACRATTNKRVTVASVM